MKQTLFEIMFVVAIIIISLVLVRAIWLSDMPMWLKVFLI